MSFLDNIKSQIGNYFLKQDQQLLKRNRMLFNLQDAKSIGIIFDASNKEDFELVKKYVNYLKEMRKKVKVIGFFSSKEVPALTYSKLEYDFFTSKQTNWYGKPSDVFIDNFIEEENDILIDLNIHEKFPLKYIAAICKAKFKVGKTIDDTHNIYDLMIQIDQPNSLKYFLRQVDTYLLMINK